MPNTSKEKLLAQLIIQILKRGEKNESKLLEAQHVHKLSTSIQV